MKTTETKTTKSLKGTTGLRFELTGAAEPVFANKAEFTAFMEKHGYIHTGLNKDTQLLITETMDSTSSKMGKAEKYGIPIKTYQEVFDELSGK